MLKAWVKVSAFQGPCISFVPKNHVNLERKHLVSKTLTHLTEFDAKFSQILTNISKMQRKTFSGGSKFHLIRFNFRPSLFIRTQPDSVWEE